MIKVTDIAFTGTPVTDMKKSRAFYEGVLGLVPSRVFENEGKSWVEYDIGPAKNTLAISDFTPEWKSSAEGTAIVLEVEDFQAALAHLKANNVPMLGEPFEAPVCWTALALDPSGNTVAIHKRK